MLINIALINDLILQDPEGSAYSFLEFYAFAGKDLQRALHMWKQSVILPKDTANFGNWSGVMMKPQTDESLSPVFVAEFDMDAIHATKVRSFSAGIC